MRKAINILQSTSLSLTDTNYINEKNVYSTIGYPSENDIRNILSKKGNTKVDLIINKNNQKAYYSLQNNRKFDLEHYNLLKSKEYVLKIIV